MALTIKMLRDEDKNHFIPYTTTATIENSATREKLQNILDRKLEATNIKAGEGVSLNIQDNDVTINCTATGSGEGSSYELPIASATELGGIKLGDGLEITEDGRVSVVVEGETYVETDPVFTDSPAFKITQDDIDNWNAKPDNPGITSESDPIFTTSPAFKITQNDIDVWNSKPSKDEVSSEIGGAIDGAGYIVEEKDPIFTKSAAAKITDGDIANWNAKADQSGILVEDDPFFKNSPAFSITEEKKAEWDAKISTETDPVFTGSPAGKITQAQIDNWDAKVGEDISGVVGDIIEQGNYATVSQIPVDISQLNNDAGYVQGKYLPVFLTIGGRMQYFDYADTYDVKFIRSRFITPTEPHVLYDYIKECFNASIDDRLTLGETLYEPGSGVVNFAGFVSIPVYFILENKVQYNVWSPNSVTELDFDDPKVEQWWPGLTRFNQGWTTDGWVFGMEQGWNWDKVTIEFSGRTLLGTRGLTMVNYSFKVNVKMDPNSLHITEVLGFDSSVYFYPHGDTNRPTSTPVANKNVYQDNMIFLSDRPNTTAGSYSTYTQGSCIQEVLKNYVDLGKDRPFERMHQTYVYVTMSGDTSCGDYTYDFRHIETGMSGAGTSIEVGDGDYGTNGVYDTCIEYRSKWDHSVGYNIYLNWSDFMINENVSSDNWAIKTIRG